MLVLNSLFSGSPDWLVKLVEEGGRTNLTLVSLVIVIIGALAYLFFGKESTSVKILTWLVMFGGAVCLVTVLLTSGRSNEQQNRKVPDTLEKPAKPPEQVMVKPPNDGVCTATDEKSFGPGDHKTGGNYGPGGGGTTLDAWEYSWAAPGKITAVHCAQPGGWEKVLSEYSNGNVAYCKGWINGGNAQIIMHISYEAPCK